jgi:hypothetical protein
MRLPVRRNREASEEVQFTQNPRADVLGSVRAHSSSDRLERDREHFGFRRGQRRYCVFLEPLTPSSGHTPHVARTRIRQTSVDYYEHFSYEIFLKN